MQVRAVKSFSARVGGSYVVWPRGKVGEMPPDADWLRVGLVEVVSLDVTPPVEAGQPGAPARKRASKSHGKTAGD